MKIILVEILPLKNKIGPNRLSWQGDLQLYSWHSGRLFLCSYLKNSLRAGCWESFPIGEFPH